MKPLDPALVRARARLVGAQKQIREAMDYVTIGRGPSDVIERIKRAEHELHLAREEARQAVTS